MITNRRTNWYVIERSDARLQLSVIADGLI